MKKFKLLALALVIGSAGLFATNLKNSNFSTIKNSEINNLKIDPTVLIQKKNTEKKDLYLNDFKKADILNVNFKMSKHFVQKIETDIPKLIKPTKILYPIVPLIATLE